MVRILFLLLCAALLATTCLTARADDGKWLIHYPVPEDVKTLNLTLAYRWWDPKIDGDLPSKKVLLTAMTVKLDPALKTVPIQILLNGAKSVVVVGKQLYAGKGKVLDPSFMRLADPKLDYNNFYILAQKPVDPKNPPAPGDVADGASAWLELEIEPKE